MKLNKQYESSNIFSDMLFNVLLTIIVITFLAILLINPKAVPDVNVKKEANYIVEMEWPENIDCDVDMWVLGPNGDYVSFANKSTQLMHIERDDMGVTSDTLSNIINGVPAMSKENREIWTLRGVWDGQFTVNAHLYACRAVTSKPGELTKIPVKIRIIRINPTYRIVYSGEKTLDKVWQEITMATFKLRDKNQIFEYVSSEFVGVVKTARGETLR